MPLLAGISDPVASRIVAASADLALVVDSEGTIVDVWLSDRIADTSHWEDLRGRPWSETVLRDSQEKVRQLLTQAKSLATSRSREINQKVQGLGDVPIRFRGALVDDEHVVALGHDLRPMAEMQQRMVSAQQAMDLEYRRLRQADTRYRVLFRVTSEGVLILNGKDRTVVEANPAAAALLGEPTDALRGRAFDTLFASSCRDDLLTLVGAVEAGGEREIALARPDEETHELAASAAMFRQSGVAYLLFRFWRTGTQAATTPRTQRMLNALEALPDGFVVTNEDLQILNANAGFCELVQHADEVHVTGQSLDRWLGRPGVDLNIIVANLREHGVVRSFSTIVRGELGGEQQAVLTAVSALDGKVPSYAFTLRPVTTSLAEAPTSTFLPRSVDQLRALVGRVSLKDIVKESADLIERLCIEAALDVSRNNRAAAAQLLGLSRQSLYSKLRRHGIGEFAPS